jgi:hypothetical protein
MYVKNVHIYLFLEQYMISIFLRVLRFPPTDRHDITEILLKAVLNSITLTPIFLYFGTVRFLKILLITL